MIYLLNIILISLFCVGLKQATEPGMLLECISNWWYDLTKVKTYEEPKGYYPVLTGYKARWIYTITLGCIYCYASFWGTVLYWTLCVIVWGGTPDLAMLIMWPVTCVACVFVNGILYNHLALLKNKNGAKHE